MFKYLITQKVFILVVEARPSVDVRPSMDGLDPPLAPNSEPWPFYNEVWPVQRSISRLDESNIIPQHVHHIAPYVMWLPLIIRLI